VFGGRAGSITQERGAEGRYIREMGKRQGSKFAAGGIDRGWVGSW
jgi:hypothetical protein